MMNEENIRQKSIRKWKVTKDEKHESFSVLLHGLSLWFVWTMTMSSLNAYLVDMKCKVHSAHSGIDGLESWDPIVHFFDETNKSIMNTHWNIMIKFKP